MALPWLRMLLVSPCLMLCMASPALAATRFVATTGNDTGNDCLAAGSPCKTITHALTQATGGDTTQVAAGTYNPTLGETFPLTVSSVGLTVVGDGANTTIIDAAGTNGVVLIQGSNVAISRV